MMNLKKITMVVLVFSLLFSFSAELKSAKQIKNVKSNVKAKIININTAGLNALTDLPRIGSKIAKRIVDFRKKHGKFRKVEDLMKVKGIGVKTFNKFRHRIKV